jgi:hypothetical protein
MFVIGKRLTGLQDRETLEAVIEEELLGSKTPLLHEADVDDLGLGPFCQPVDPVECG